MTARYTGRYGEPGQLSEQATSRTSIRAKGKLMADEPEASKSRQVPSFPTKVTVISLLEDKHGLKPTVVAVKRLRSWDEAEDYQRGLNRVLGR